MVPFIASVLPIERIDGMQEARYFFLAALHGLPVENGLPFDLGGGSIQISRFRHPRLERIVASRFEGA